jgi:hypothetical protein
MLFRLDLLLVVKSRLSLAQEAAELSEQPVQLARRPGWH